jgi:DNA-binding winged helix-turn-helix (wHTH) protein/tetratricopeptide (TPR) repeat protein
VRNIERLKISSSFCVEGATIFPPAPQLVFPSGGQPEMPADIYRFADFELDRSAYQLRRKGRPVRIERIPLDLLFLLAERPGQLVTREEILERIWGKAVFLETDHSINTAVQKIRRVLRDGAETPRFVATVPTKGYRFVAPLREIRREIRPEPPNVASRHDGEKGVRPPPSSMVGRARELAELRSGLTDARAGRGSLLLISGEPGIGKSRLSAELASFAQASAMAVRLGQCLDREEVVPYLPFVEILESCLERSSNPRELRKQFGNEGPELTRLLPRLGRLLPDLTPPLDLPPRETRRHLFNSFCDFTARLVREQPTLFIIEDLHWADDSTLSLLNHLVKRLSKLPLLVVGTFRGTELEVSPALAKTLEDLLRGHLAHRLRLQRLSPDEVAEMLTHLSGMSPPAKVVTEIYDETEGNPFFVEELFLHFKEENRLYDASGHFRSDLRIGELDAPQSVRMVVGRRLARLSDPTRKCLGTMAAIGRSFSFEVLQAAITTDADSLLESVAEAERAGLIFSSEKSGKARFEFSHELIRQAVLRSLSAAMRERLHLRVAQAIERVYSEVVDDHVTELAYHYARSANTLMAVEYLTRAAQWAYDRSADKEAEAHLKSAMSLIALLPEQARAACELKVQLLTADTAFTLRGYAAPEVRDATKRALVLARRLGDREAEFKASSGLYFHYQFSGNFAPLREIAEAMLKLAEASGEPRLRLEAHHHLGVYLHLHTSDFVHAREHYEKAMEVYHSASDHDPGMKLGYAIVKAMLGEVLGQLGFLDQAVTITRGAVEFAREESTAFIHGWSLNWMTTVYRERLDIGETLAATDALEAVVKEYGLSDHDGRILVARGWATARQGQLSQNLEMTNLGLEMLGAALNTYNRVEAQLAIAEISFFAGDAERGLAALKTLESWGPMGEGSAVFWLQFFKGCFLTIGDDNQPIHEAEALFRACLQHARKWQWKLPELHTAIGLAHLMARTGRREEARTMLADTYNWFTEGFDTMPLKGAKALLDDLSG